MSIFSISTENIPIKTDKARVHSSYGKGITCLTKEEAPGPKDAEAFIVTKSTSRETTFNFSPVAQCTLPQPRCHPPAKASH